MPPSKNLVPQWEVTISTLICQGRFEVNFKVSCSIECNSPLTVAAADAIAHRSRLPMVRPSSLFVCRLATVFTFLLRPALLRSASCCGSSSYFETSDFLAEKQATKLQAPVSAGGLQNSSLSHGGALRQHQNSKCFGFFALLNLIWFPDDVLRWSL